MIVFNHPIFQRPENTNVTIWRYMDFAKFVSMLEVEGGSLHFTRFDELRKADDFEGLPPKAIQEKIEQDDTQALSSGVDPKLIECKKHYAQKSAPYAVCANSWYCAEHESTAMWRIYGGLYGIAVRSTIHRLIDALQETKEKIRIGLVKYGDKEYDNLESHNNKLDVDHWILHKRQSYEHEKELRLVLGGTSSGTELPENGITVRVSNAKLIEAVAIAPDASPWLADLVRQLCKRYELHDVKVLEPERPLW